MRPRIEEAVEGEASVTSALAGMLEILPLGASKAAGVEVVLETLGIKKHQVLALGDAENDLQMLKMAGVCCYMPCCIQHMFVVHHKVGLYGRQHVGVRADFCGDGECFG